MIPRVVSIELVHTKYLSVTEIDPDSSSLEPLPKLNQAPASKLKDAQYGPSIHSANDNMTTKSIWQRTFMHRYVVKFAVGMV
jgi:hypothetical protein